MNLWFVSFLFNGIAIPIDAVIWPFRVFCYVLPYRWAQAAITYTIFIFSPQYNGAEPCNITTSLPPNGSPENRTVSCDPTTPDEHGFGFYCPNLDPAQCFGRTGAQLLNSIGQTFTSVSATDDWHLACLYMLAMALFFKLHFYGLLVLQCSSNPFDVLKMPWLRQHDSSDVELRQATIPRLVDAARLSVHVSRSERL